MPIPSDPPVEPDKLADEIVRRYAAGELRYQPTVLSTSCSVILDCRLGAAVRTFTFEGTDALSLRREIVNLSNAGYKFTVEDARQTSSLWQDLLGSARTALAEQGLSGNPSPSVVVQAVISTGNSLFNQLEEDSRSKGHDGICDKLQAVGLGSGEDLYKKYKNLNPFFNSTKHRDRDENRIRRARLEGPDGWLIAMDYFECVRQVFRWYYAQKSAVPKWKELEPIDCSQFPIKYAFDLMKRW